MTQTIKEFTENTTFHGVKFIFEGNGFSLRRILWLLFVLGAILGVVLQVFLRVEEFFLYKTNVDVKLFQADDHPFPAVTICNHNTFKLTKAVKYDTYTVLDEFFNTRNDTILDEAIQLDMLNTTKFLEDVAHSLNDMVISCEWSGKPCDIEKDFAVIITDMGVCYTFNGDLHAIRNVSEPGARYGLSMVLNVEQYEYMRGPHQDAGIKMLLHNQRDFPMVNDQGFSLAPGMHTLVAMTRKDNIFLDDTRYGNCIGQSNYSQTQCLLECYTSAVWEDCSCVGHYMINVNETYEVCPINTLYTCIPESLEKIKQIGRVRCNCPIPCTKRSFNPTLSYAQISKLNIDQLIRSAKASKIVEDFRLSSDTSHRVISSIVESDNMQFEAYEKYLTDIEDAIDIFRSNWHNAKGRKDILFNERYFLFENDFMISNKFHKTNALMNPMRTKFSTTVHIYGTLHNLTQVPTGSDTVSIDSFIEGCFGELNLYPQVNVSICSQKLEHTREKARDIMATLDKNVSYSTNFAQEFLRNVNALYTDTLESANSVTEHLKCKNFLEDFSKQVEYLSLLKIATNDFNGGDNYQTLLNNSRKMVTNFDKLSNFECTHKYVLKMCFWMLSSLPDNHDTTTTTLGPHQGVETPSFKPGEEVRRCSDGRVFQQIYAQIDDAAKRSSFKKRNTILVGNTSALRNFIVDELLTTYDELNNINVKLENLIPQINSFKDNNITKLELANQVVSKIFTTNKEEIMSKIVTLMTKLNTMSLSLDKISYDFVHLYDELYQLNIPALDSKNIYRLQVLNDVKTFNLTIHEPLLHKENLQNTIRDVMMVYSKNLTDHIIALNSAINDFSYTFEILQDNMNFYIKESEVDADFYMSNILQVDVFYSDMWFEQIEQQPAFVLLSLLGEVGGFLGLLLGASVLTFCEIVDFIFQMCISCCRRTKDDDDDGAKEEKCKSEKEVPA